MEKTKQRLLRVLDIIKSTDEQHPITANEIVAELQRYGIEAERKAVLRDIEALVDRCEIKHQRLRLLPKK